MENLEKLEEIFRHEYEYNKNRITQYNGSAESPLYNYYEGKVISFGYCLNRVLCELGRVKECVEL